MPQCCAVPFCSERKGGHKFPKDKTLLKQWLIAIRRDNYTPSKHSRVCKKHFSADDYTLPKEPTTENPTLFLKQKAVPSRFSWNLESEERKEIKRKRAERVIQRQIKRETRGESATLHSHAGENQCEEYSNVEEACEEIDIETSNKEVSVQCSLCNCSQVKSLINTVNLSEYECNKESTQNMFGIENLKNKPDQVQFYTGFINYKHFLFVFNLFGDEVNNLKYYPSLQSAQGKHTLSPCNQFYLTMIKLRRNKCNKELSFHFEISGSSVSKYFITWINYLYCKFKDLKVWAPNEVIDENSMLGNKSNTSIIIHSREIKIEKPQNPVAQQATYSKAKSGNTLKVLVGISSSGCVTFISEAFGGSISDTKLFEKCGIINQLHRGDIILCDRGFDIQELVSHMDVTVNKPQFLQKRSNQFEAHQVRKSKKFSSEYSNVEHVRDLGKTYKILSNTLESNLVPLGGRIIFVCFMLANFRNNIV